MSNLLVVNVEGRLGKSKRAQGTVHTKNGFLSATNLPNSRSKSRECKTRGASPREESKGPHFNLDNVRLRPCCSHKKLA